MPLAWEKGKIQNRVGKSPWSIDDAELLAELQEAGTTTMLSCRRGIGGVLPSRSWAAR